LALKTKWLFPGHKRQLSLDWLSRDSCCALLTLLNKSMMTNRRRQHPLNAEEKLGRAVHAPHLLSAAVAYLSCWPDE